MHAKRGVTRAYVWTLIFACVLLSLAIISAAWGLTALFADTVPIASQVFIGAGPLLVGLALAFQAWTLGKAAIFLLKGSRRPPYHWLLLPGLCGYLVWCIGGMAFGMRISETWLSWYSLALVPIFWVTGFLCWITLWMRVYTNRESPRWPWERREELEQGIAQIEDYLQAADRDRRDRGAGE